MCKRENLWRRFEDGDRGSFEPLARVLTRREDFEDLRKVQAAAWRLGEWEALFVASRELARVDLSLSEKRWCSARWHAWFAYYAARELCDFHRCIEAAELWASTDEDITEALDPVEKRTIVRDRFFELFLPGTPPWAVYGGLYRGWSFTEVARPALLASVVEDGHILPKGSGYTLGPVFPSLPEMPLPPPVYKPLPARSEMRRDGTGGQEISRMRYEDYHDLSRRGAEPRDLWEAAEHAAGRLLIPFLLRKGVGSSESLRYCAHDLYAIGFDRIPTVEAVFRARSRRSRRSAIFIV